MKKIFFTNRFKRVLCVIFVLILFLSGARPLNAFYVQPDIFLEKLEIENTPPFSANNPIKGSVIITSQEEKYFAPGLRVVFELYSEGGEKENPVLLERDESMEFFTLAPQVFESKEFSFEIPSGVESGKAVFRATLENSQGFQFFLIEKDIEVNGTGNFLIINREDEVSVEKIGEELVMKGGSFFPEGEIPTFNIGLSNPSQEKYLGFCDIESFHLNDPELSVQSGKEIALDPGSDDVLSIRVEKLKKPGRYLTKIRCFSTDKSEPVSNILMIPWTMLKEDGQFEAYADLKYLLADRASYDAGETAKVKVLLENAVFEKESRTALQITITSDAEIAGFSEKILSLNDEEVILDVKIDKPAAYPVLLAEIVNNGRTLDYCETTLSTKVAADKTGGEEKTRSNLSAGWIAVLITVLIASIIVFYLWKSTKKSG